MKRDTLILAGLLLFAILTLWVEPRWAWSAFQIGVCLLSIGRFVRPGRFPWSAALGPLVCAAVWPWLQLALGTAVSPAQAAFAAWNWLTFFLVCALALDLGSEPAELRRLLRTLVIAGVLIAVAAAIQQVTSHGKIFWLFPSGYADGLLGPFVNRNQYSAWVELLLPIALYLASGRNRYRALYLSAAAALYGSVVAGASRAGFLLVTGEAVIVPAVMAFRNRLPRKTLVQFAGLAAAAILTVGWQGLQMRLEDASSEDLRIDALQASVQMALEHPLTGSGLGSWPQMYPHYARFDTGVAVNQAHNDWAQWAAEGGIPFFGFLLAFAIICSKPAIRSIYGLGVVAFLLHALVDYPMQQRPGLAAWFFAVAGAVLARSNARVREL